MTSTLSSDHAPSTKDAPADRDGLLQAAQRLGPLICEHAAAAERNRRLSPEVIRALTDRGFFRLLTPRSLGGLEVDPITCSLVAETLAGFDSAAGWALQSGNVGAWWAARLPKEGTEEIYGRNPSAIEAGAFHPPQQAREAPGGYRVTGRAPLASTIHDAQWLFLTALVMDGDRPRLTDGTPHVVALVLRAGDVEIVDTWDSLGMRGTDSNDVVIHDVFVPTSRSFPLVTAFEPGPHHGGPLYRFPVIGGAFFTIAPVPLAVARNAIGEVRNLVQQKTAFGFNRPLRERAVVQTTLARAEAMLRAARLLYYDTLERAWQRTVAGTPHTIQDKADLLLAAAHSTATAAEVADMMHRIGGTTGIYAASPLERHFRDAQTLRHHGFLSENRFEAVGQVYCGVVPEFMMLGF
jgi:alkylation response protein AidB-like acyl-CoA dehydrogenase